KLHAADTAMQSLLSHAGGHDARLLKSEQLARTYGFQRELAEAFSVVFLDMRHQSLAHAWIPRTLEMTDKFVNRLIAVAHRHEKIADLVCHLDQRINVIAAHSCLPSKE